MTLRTSSYRFLDHCFISCFALYSLSLAISQTCNHANAVSCTCTAGTAPVPSPPTGTSSPTVTGASPTPGDPNAICDACPPSSYTMLASNGCTGFYYCNAGSASPFTPCPEGTLYDSGFKGCNWVDKVTCSC